MTASAGPVLKALHDEFGDRVAFVTLYVREAHPGDRYPQPERSEDKLRHARDYRALREIPWPVAVDDIDGTLHRALDGKPSSVYLMAPDGRIAYRVLWSNDPAGVRSALDTLLAGGAPGQSEAKMVPMLSGLGSMKPVLTTAGTVALDDVKREAPPLFVLAQTASLFSPLPPLGRGLAAAATMVAAIGLVGFAARQIARRG